MTSRLISGKGFAERAGEVLEWAAEVLFLVAFGLLTFKLFWSIVRDFTLFGLDIILG
jgi:hypothetical protein